MPVPATDSDVVIADLTCGQTYYFRMRAVEGVDAGAWTTPAKSCYPAPAAPYDFLAAPLTLTSVKLTWKANTSGTGYKVYHGNALIATISDKTKESFVDNTLTAGQTYEYFIATYKTVSGKTVETPADERAYLTYTAVLPAPANFTLASDGIKRIKLTWKAIDGVSGYHIYASGNAGKKPELIATVNTNVTSYIDTEVVTGMTYYYYISAFVSDTEGIATETKDITCCAAALEGLTANPINDTSIKLSQTSQSKVSGDQVYFSTVSKTGPWTLLADLTDGSTYTTPN